MALDPAANAAPVPDAAPVENPTTAPAAPEMGAEPAIASSPSLFLPALKERGYELPEDLTDDDVLAEFEELSRFRETAPSQEELEQLRAAQQQFAKYQPYQAEFEEFLKSRQAPAGQPPANQKPEAAEAEEEFEIPRAPVMPDGLEASLRFAAQQGYVTRNEKGAWTATNPMYSAVAQQANEYIAKQQMFADTVARDPVGFYSKITQREARNLLKPVLEELNATKAKLGELEAFRKQLSVRDRIDQDAMKFYQAGENGQYEMTPYARAYQAQAEFLQKNLPHLKDPEELHALAEAWATLQAAQAAPAVPGSTQGAAGGSATPAEKKKSLFRNRLIANRNSVPANGHKQILPSREPARSEQLSSAMGNDKPSFHDLISEELARHQ